MINMVEGYVRNLTKEDINNFALNNSINLSRNELDFTYDFIKTNYKEVLNNKSNFDFNVYRSKFSEGNFDKINQLINKYSAFL